MKAFRKHLHNNPVTCRLRKPIRFSWGYDKPECDPLTVVRPFARAWRVLQLQPNPFKTIPRNPCLRSGHYCPPTPIPTWQSLIHNVLFRRQCQPASSNGSHLWVSERNFNQFLQMKMLITLHFLPTWKHTHIHTHLPPTRGTLDNENKQKIPSNIFLDTLYIVAETIMASWHLPTSI